jgi:cytochrome c
MALTIEKHLAMAALIVGAAVTAPTLLLGESVPGCDLESGRRVFFKCIPCHTLEMDGPHGVGPNLHGVIGRKAGRAPGYKYSGPFRQVDLVWSREALDLYLQNPATFVGENWMPFGGLKRPEDRKAVICYVEEAAK